MKLEIPSGLRQEILSLDGLGYKAYKALQGKSFSYGSFSVKFEHNFKHAWARWSRRKETVMTHRVYQYSRKRTPAVRSTSLGIMLVLTKTGVTHVKNLE